MKIAHLVSSLKVGGAERFVLDLCRSQQQKDIPIVITFGTPDEPLVAVAKQQETKVETLGALSKWQMYRRAFSILKHVDVIHIHSQHVLKTLMPILPFLNRQQLIYTRHGEKSLNTKTWQWVHKLASNSVDAVTAVSPQALNRIIDDHRWHDKRAHYINNGVVLDGIVQAQQKCDKFRFGSVGRMVSLKSQKDLIYAASKLPIPIANSVSLNFFGDGPERIALQKLTEELQLTCEVNFHGMVYDRNAIYSNIDCLVVTSETEGLSLAIMEAMAYGIPTIATQVGGNPELVTNSENGYLYSFGDRDTLALIMQDVSSNPDNASRLGKNARRFIERSYSIEQTANQYFELYSS